MSKGKPICANTSQRGLRVETSQEFFLAWPEIFSEKTLKKIQKENPWLFDRGIKKTGLFGTSMKLITHIPQALQRDCPYAPPPNSETPFWHNHISLLLYKYLVQDMFPEFNSFTPYGQIKVNCADSVAVLTFAATDEGYAFDIGVEDRAVSDAMKQRQRYALEKMKAQAEEYQDKLEPINVKDYMESFSKGTGTVKD